MKCDRTRRRAGIERRDIRERSLVRNVGRLDRFVHDIFLPIDNDYPMFP